jgi:hypothetical protein
VDPSGRKEARTTDAVQHALAADAARAARPPRYDCDGGLRRPHLALRQKRRSLAGRRAMLPASKAMDIQDASSSLTGQAGIGRVTFPRPASTVTVGGAVFGAPNQRRSQ